MNGEYPIVESELVDEGINCRRVIKEENNCGVTELVCGELFLFPVRYLGLSESPEKHTERKNDC